MNKRALIFFFLFIVFAMGQGKVPNVRLKMLDGSSAKLYDYLKDGPMIIDFWATWCDCLLYTSPSPRDVEESRMPSSA